MSADRQTWRHVLQPALSAAHLPECRQHSSGRCDAHQKRGGLAFGDDKHRGVGIVGAVELKCQLR
jgi:hypothetical protein